jgi:hypothetical protein
MASPPIRQERTGSAAMADPEFAIRVLVLFFFQLRRLIVVLGDTEQCFFRFR